jgi:hypothetical protein
MNRHERWRAAILLVSGALLLVAAGVQFAAAYRWDPSAPFYLNGYYLSGVAYLLGSAGLVATWWLSRSAGAPASAEGKLVRSIGFLALAGAIAVFALATAPWRDARARIYETLFLAVGKEAPEIEGEDTEGQPLRLSDYRGKVVLLKFWGFW